MARVTVEDCILKIPNRFDLVMVAAQRSREVSSGSELTVDRDNDKNPVVALREIADETVDIGHLEESLVRGLQRHVEVDEPEEDNLEAIMSGQPDAEAVAEVQSFSNPSGMDDDSAEKMGMNIRAGGEEAEAGAAPMGGGFEDVDESVLGTEQ